jgi:hypothetical protein
MHSHSRRHRAWKSGALALVPATFLGSLTLSPDAAVAVPSGPGSEDVAYAPLQPDGHGMFVNWFGPNGNLQAIGIGETFDSGVEAPSNAVSYSAQGYVKATANGQRVFTVGASARCDVKGTEIATSGTTIALTKGELAAFRCTVTDVDDVGLRWGTSARAVAPIVADDMRTGTHGLDDIANGTRGLPTTQAPNRGRSWTQTLAGWTNAQGDDDRDGLKDNWEFDGYTVELKTNGVSRVVKWAPNKHEGKDDAWGNPFVKYTSSAVKATTNSDPWSDFEKATGRGLLDGISPEAQHPLVTAMPDVQVAMEKYKLIKNEDWSSSSGGENRTGVTQTVTNGDSTNQTIGAGAECGAKPGRAEVRLKLSCSINVNYSYNWGTTHEESESAENSSSQTWNELISGSTSRAAIVLPSIRYENEGTAPISDADPRFTLSLGDQELVSAISNQANNLAEALPGEHYPAKGTPALAFQSVNDFQSPIAIDQDTYRTLQARAAGDSNADDLRVSTGTFDATVVFEDADGLPYPSNRSWASVRNSVRATNALLDFTSPHGEGKRRYIAAKGTGLVEQTVPQLTLGESLALTHGAKEIDGQWYIDGYAIDETAFEMTMSQKASDALAAFDGDMFDLPLTAGMQIGIHPIAATTSPEWKAQVDRVHHGYTQSDPCGSGPAALCTTLISLEGSDEPRMEDVEVRLEDGSMLRGPDIGWYPSHPNRIEIDERRLAADRRLPLEGWVDLMRDGEKIRSVFIPAAPYLGIYTWHSKWDAGA